MRSKLRFAAVYLVLFGVLTQNPSLASTVDAVPGEVVVTLKQSDQTSGMLSSMQATLGMDAVLDIQPLSTQDNIQVLRFASEEQTAQALEQLNQNPSVQYAEPNYIYRASAVPNDPDFGKLWGLQNTGQKDSKGKEGLKGVDIGVMPLWDQGQVGSPQILVAVIDSGIEWDHPNLKENLHRPTTKLKGFEAEVHGWNFFNKTANSNDDNGHGTHCAGTIGAVGNKGIGIAGVNWRVSLLPVKFLSKDGSGTLAGALDAINFARLKKSTIMSNSWGGGGKSQAMQDAIEAAQKEGILFVAAAGNNKSDNDVKPTYPASYIVDNVLSVAAINNRGELASFSNYGKKSVHVAAPGENIYSTVLDGNYEHYSGTSMATPHVAGAAALMMSLKRGWTYKDIRKRLIETSTPLASLKNRVASMGRVHVANAVSGTKFRGKR